MVPVKTMPRFKCDFCNKRSIKRVMELHEKRCFRNPNRFCELCENKGYTEEYYEGIGTRKTDCPYCSKFDPEKLKEIEAREQEGKVFGEEKIDASEVPF